MRLSSSEQADAKRRGEADAVREEGRKRFKREAERRVETLRGSIKELRETMIVKGGIKGVFDVVRETPRKEDLPEEYQQVLEYGRISFVLSPSSSLCLLSCLGR